MTLQLKQDVVWIFFVSLLCIGILKCEAVNHGDVDELKGNDGEDSGLCPAENPRYPVYLPHQSECNKFYICDSGIPHLQVCHPGLHFNPKLKACDYPRNSGCNKGDEESNGKMINEEGSGLCPTENSKFPVYLPHPSECNKFYMCDSGIPHLKECQPNLHFNPKIKACDFPANAGCSEGSGDEQKPEGRLIDKEDSGLCPAENSRFPVYLPHSSECNKFYICDSGIPHLKICHPGLHFNPKLKACDYPQNAGCQEEDIEKPKGKDMDDNDSGLCPAVNSEFPTYFPHPSECHKFYMCDSGIPHFKECQPGLHFNPKIKACDYPANAGCKNGATKALAGVPSPFCPTRDGKIPIFFRHASNCSVFYMCGNGLAYEFVCPARLHFNIRKRMCDYEDNAGCPNWNP